LTRDLAHDLLMSDMSEHSSIEWTDATWNPVRGCTKISPGCKHCYAETFAERFRGVPGHPFEHGFEMRLVPDKLAEPLRWGRSRKVFVNSMSDLFHERVPDPYIRAVFEVMRTARWHTYQVLTKRAERLRSFTRAAEAAEVEFDHVWLGVSVENRKHGLPRIDALRRARAGKRFLSIEPLLEDLGEFDLEGIDWVIVGGESGRGAREMAPEWAEAIRDRCRAAKVPFFFKQWGGVNKKRRGRILAGRTHDAMPKIRRVDPPRLSDRRTLLAQFQSQTRDLPTLVQQPLVALRPTRPRSAA
jgi:protein gp37